MKWKFSEKVIYDVLELYVDGGHVISYTKSQQGYDREPEYDVVEEGYSELSWWKTAIEDGSVWTELYYWPPWDAVVTSYAIPIVLNNQVVAVTGGELFYEDVSRSRVIGVVYAGKDVSAGE